PRPGHAAGAATGRRGGRGRDRLSPASRAHLRRPQDRLRDARARPGRSDRRLAGASRPDTSTIASLATAGGTLILAVATFSSTRSANRAARVSEQALK